MTLEHEGYVARIDLDEDGDFHGRVINTRDVISFHGRTAEDLRREFAASVAAYEAFCARRGKAPEKPFSGRLLLRIPPELHKALTIAAADAGTSINRWIGAQLARSVRRARGTAA